MSDRAPIRPLLPGRADRSSPSIGAAESHAVTRTGAPPAPAARALADTSEGGTPCTQAVRRSQSNQVPACSSSCPPSVSHRQSHSPAMLLPALVVNMKMSENPSQPGTGFSGNRLNPGGKLHGTNRSPSNHDRAFYSKRSTAVPGMIPNPSFERHAPLMSSGSHDFVNEVPRGAISGRYASPMAIVKSPMGGYSMPSRASAIACPRRGASRSTRDPCAMPSGQGEFCNMDDGVSLWRGPHLDARAPMRPRPSNEQWNRILRSPSRRG